jgi:hypothetical protein
MMFGIFGAYPTTLVFGGPAFLVLQGRIAANWINCVAAGAVVAALPWFLLSLLGPAADEASIGGQATVINGVRTGYGWLVEFQFIGEVALFGAVAGLLFWLIATGGRNLPAGSPSDEGI